MILGGHDHSSLMEQYGRVTLIKSGSDFEEFSDVIIHESGNVERKRIVITDKFPPDLETSSIVDKYTN